MKLLQYQNPLLLQNNTLMELLVMRQSHRHHLLNLSRQAHHRIFLFLLYRCHQYLLLHLPLNHLFLRGVEYSEKEHLFLK
jgi:hypothetical protein